MNGALDDGDMAVLLDAYQEQLRSIAAAQQRRVQLTGTATSRDKTVTVTVNANGVVIETKFSSGVAGLSYQQIAKTVTQVAQDAAADVARQNQQLIAPLTFQQARLPKLSELIEGMPDLTSDIPVEPPVSIAPPGSHERGADEVTAMEFSDVEEYNHNGPEPRTRRITDSSW